MVPLSIGIPTYNRADSVARLLRAINGQALPADQVFVSDDASDDHTKQVVESYPSFTLYEQSANLGMVANWNHCLEVADREWVCLIHDDDELCKDGLDAMRMCCHLLREPALIVHRYSEKNEPSFSLSLQYPSIQSVLNCLTIPSGAVLHREIIEQIGCFDERYAYSADLEYFARIAHRFPVVVIETPNIVKYNLHGANYQFRTWRLDSFYHQFEQLQRTIVSYASNLGDLDFEAIVERRLIDNYLYMLRTALQFSEYAAVGKICERLTPYFKNLSRRRQLKFMLAKYYSRYRVSIRPPC